MGYRVDFLLDKCTPYKRFLLYRGKVPLFPLPPSSAKVCVWRVAAAQRDGRAGLQEFSAQQSTQPQYSIVSDYVGDKKMYDSKQIAQHLT